MFHKIFLLRLITVSSSLISPPRKVKRILILSVFTTPESICLLAADVLIWNQRCRLRRKGVKT
ncbi:hypothetical protein CLOSTASPAR_04771 [[Clostridium] asparagiforme DSM 15981]|uniref:Uncharacterized protein n=1 Tax=[Clostridium] asparagiforme DSM 15981 TaxID=518636 RepID=C0D676_9FIRM|nr:hypothetical protein CLOSTASPAR_04771 [[Clostridium] asparagiforme DSM 15981]